MHRQGWGPSRLQTAPLPKPMGLWAKLSLAALAAVSFCHTAFFAIGAGLGIPKGKTAAQWQIREVAGGWQLAVAFRQIRVVAGRWQLP